ncbi:MAG: hycE [Myxococcaceae bacterium]|nr:hycE [Myxococcaceae bacterium]
MSALVVDPAEHTCRKEAFFERLRAQLSEGARLVGYYGRPADDSGQVVITAVLSANGKLSVLRTGLSRPHSHRALSAELPAFQIFERELHEQYGLRLHEHPWLKPVRSDAPYPFYSLKGKEVHEVAVGPIHAGVIEPGHFRFMCLGEVVHHLEIQLGYQHRGVEALLLKKDPRALGPLVETIAGDTSVAHAWAYCEALEALAGVTTSFEAQVSRAIGLELERIAMHLASLAGMATDIAFLQGGTTYGRLRTTAINSSMLACGSRFGRGWVRPGGAWAKLESGQQATLRANLKLLKDDLAIINPHLLGARSVQHRLKGIGRVTREQAIELGIVGVAARASGIEVDARADLPGPVHLRYGIRGVIENSGDCWARAVVRIREIDESLRWLEEVLDAFPTCSPDAARVGALKPDTLAVAVCEGWRGEVVHCLETDAAGGLRHYKVQDPSLRNWFALALSLRENEISDFPICNKSFDLSYCGNDL